MKLLFITKEDCIYCIEQREMVYHELPSLIPGLEIEELDIYRDEKKYQRYYDDSATPAFIMLTNTGKKMFQITGLPPSTQFILSLVESYESVKKGLLTDEELELVVGGLRLKSTVECNQTTSTCVSN